MSKLKEVPSLKTQPFSIITEEDVYLFREGKHFKLYEKMGSHLIEIDGIHGTQFAVWAPNAENVSVIGDFNNWNPNANPLFNRWDSSGIWEGFLPGINSGALYKYAIKTKHSNQILEKTDPFAFRWEIRPKSASIVWDINYSWNENFWISNRNKLNHLDSPISIYEMHIGSWKKENEMPLSYSELAKELPLYINKMGFTHVQFLPIMEHPFDQSWGYQTLGYFAPTSRFGTPQEFMSLIEALHENGIGVFLDWVPSHFPSDAHGLAQFDGTFLYEHQDPKQGFHPDWKSSIFNYGRLEVVSFLISSALFWLDKYHIDGLRVDAVASMLYLDYSRKEGEWIPNEYGGRENLDAIHFLKQLNYAVYQNYPYAQTIAEESTAWPMVSRPTYLGGLGFGMKWNMGWMHDTLLYFSRDPVYRKHHQDDITFSMIYAYHENYVLPLSHDEVVHGKSSLLSKMPGDDWKKFANLRMLLTFMYLHPGKKLLFMGAEFGMWDEWDCNHALPWHFMDYERHSQLQKLVSDLNHFYRSEPALYEQDFTHKGFKWIDLNNREECVISFLRIDKTLNRYVICICNFTPLPRENYKIGVPLKGNWKEVFNTDSHYYGGSDLGNMGEVLTLSIQTHGYSDSIAVTLPPLSILCFINAEDSNNSGVKKK